MEARRCARGPIFTDWRFNAKDVAERSDKDSADTFRAKHRFLLLRRTRLLSTFPLWGAFAALIAAVGLWPNTIGLLLNSLASVSMSLVGDGIEEIDAQRA